MSKLESLDGDRFQPIAQDEASRLTGGKLTAIGRCHIGNEIETDYSDDGFWSF